MAMIKSLGRNNALGDVFKSEDKDEETGDTAFETGKLKRKTDP